MKIVNFLLVACFLISASSIKAEEITADNKATAYIADDLFIYMHAGAGNNYRILGTINAGEEIVLTGNDKNEYTEIIDGKGRKTWVESKYISRAPSLRVAIADLNGKLASAEESNQQQVTALTQANNKISQLQAQNKQLESQLSFVNKDLTTTKSKLSTQDLDIKKEYFFNGAIVLVIGLLFGLILPRLIVRKKASMDNWK